MQILNCKSVRARATLAFYIIGSIFSLAGIDYVVTAKSKCFFSFPFPDNIVIFSGPRTFLLEPKITLSYASSS